MSEYDDFLHNARPAMGPGEPEMIAECLGPDKVMLEWGSGASTLYFSRLCRAYYSIEHDAEWAARVSKAISDNTQLVHVDTEKSGVSAYVQAPSLFTSAPEKYDVILIDGRHRYKCAVEALKYCRPDTVVFIHDFFQRKKKRHSYKLALKHYDLVDQIIHEHKPDWYTLAKLRVKAS